MATPEPTAQIELHEKHVNGDMPNLISKADQDLILKFNSRKIEVANETISRLVSKSAQNTPAGIAVDSWDMSLSFATLESLSTRLSQHLRETLGCERKPIMTVFRKSALAVVVLLAILKSGNFYVPADPSHPRSRIQAMKKQAGCSAILTSRECKKATTGVDGAPPQVITFDMIYALPSADAVEDASQLEGSCVVLFTSGSTGTPKGVLLSHKAVATSLSDHGSRIGVSTASRMLSFASFAFDAHLWDTWTCLIHGGTVCIPNEKDRMDDLQGFMTRLKIDVALLVPAALEALEPNGLSNLQTLIVGGEAVTTHQLGRWAGTGIRVVNAYGPTECSVMSTLNLDLKASDPTDLGQPVGGQCWIVDPDDHNILLPCGTEGELVVTGEHLAQRYIADDVKTAAAFVYPQWPSWAPQGQRAYRTGDLAILDAQGILRIRGRKDRQIKLHGLRIERTELEHLIASCELHDSVPVVEKVSGAWGDRLVCFMVPRGIQAPFFALLVHAQELDLLEATVRSRLRESVPSGWVPSHFVFVTKIPLNTSDKVDRARLLRAYEERFASSLRHDSGIATPSSEAMPSSHAAHISQGETEVRPTEGLDSIVQTIRKVWARVLAMSESQVRDNIDFLRLGGSSLHAIRVVSAMRAQGLLISTTQILSNATVRDLAVSCLSESQSQARVAAGDCEDPPPFSLL
jgi:amino acid adenylation domain-containing protein